MTANDSTERPLTNRTVLVARPRRQAEDLARMLSAIGAQVEFQPAIEIDEPDDWGPLDQAIERVDGFDWIVFSSTNGVDAFFGRIKDPEKLASTRLAAIGPGTAARIRDFGFNCDLMPVKFRAEALADALALHVEGRRVLLIRASRGRKILADRLKESGADVEQAVAYVSRDVLTPDPRIVALLEKGKIDWIAVTSSAIARSLVAMLGELLRNARLAAVSPITAGVLQECGFKSAVVADRHDMLGIVEAIRTREKEA